MNNHLYLRPPLVLAGSVGSEPALGHVEAPAGQRQIRSTLRNLATVLRYEQSISEHMLDRSTTSDLLRRR